MKAQVYHVQINVRDAARSDVFDLANALARLGPVKNCRCSPAVL